MNNLKIVLNDNTEISIDSITFPANITKTYESKDEMVAAWDLFTPKNLSNFTVYENDVESVKLSGYILDSIQIVYNLNGSITTHFYLRMGKYQSVVVDEVKEAKEKAILDKVESLGGFQTKEEQSDKLGFNWETEYLGDIVISRKYKEQAIKQGTMLNPFKYEEGMTLIEGAYYRDGLKTYKVENGELVRQSILSDLASDVTNGMTS